MPLCAGKVPYLIKCSKVHILTVSLFQRGYIRGPLHCFLVVLYNTRKVGLIDCEQLPYTPAFKTRKKSYVLSLFSVYKLNLLLKNLLMWVSAYRQVKVNRYTTQTHTHTCTHTYAPTHMRTCTHTHMHTHA